MRARWRRAAHVRLLRREVDSPARCRSECCTLSRLRGRGTITPKAHGRARALLTGAVSGKLRKARRAATLLDLAQHHSDSGAAATLARRCPWASRSVASDRSDAVEAARSGGFTRVSARCMLSFARCMSVADRANRRIGERIFRFVRKAGATALPAHLAVVQPPTQERVSLKRKSSELEARVGSSAKPKRHRAVAICCGWRRLKRRDWSSIFRPSKARSR